MAGLEYEFYRSRRARRLTITVRLDGSVRVTAPLSVSRLTAESFLRQRSLWVEKVRARLAASPDWNRRHYGKKEYRAYKEQARALVLARLAYFWPLYRTLAGTTAWRRVAIRDQKSRWGSCSAKGNLNFNYKIFILPPELQDYIIVHELCHLFELNHGPRFWALVAKAVPEYNNRRKELAGKIKPSCSEKEVINEI
jgi:predicted metal-dependent hydrolase